MKVLLPQATSQNLQIRARANAGTVDVVLTISGTDTTYSSISTTYSTDGYLTVPIAHDFSEGERYKVEITDNGDSSLVWRGVIFITSQTPQTYKING